MGRKRKSLIMYGIDESLDFKPINIAVLTVSDTRDEQTDTSGQHLLKRAASAGHKIADRKIVADDISTIKTVVSSWIANPEIDAIISTGGTGFSQRDVTPEAIEPLFEKTIDGFSAIFHQVSFTTVGLSTLKSRACAGLANHTFIFCLPGSNGAVKDAWDNIIKYQLDSRYKPCNLVALIPRFQGE